MRLFSILLLAVLATFSACKKNVDSAPIPVIDSNFLKFTSNVSFGGNRNYVAAKTGFKSNELERNGIRNIVALSADYVPGTYGALIYFTGRFDPPQIQLPLTIDIGQNLTNPVAAGLNLAFSTSNSNNNNWYSTAGSLTIIELGNGRAKGYFNTTLINDSLAGKTIELTQGTFNFEY